MFPHNCRYGDDLFVSRDLRVLHEIDDRDTVASGEMFFAYLLEIAEDGG